MRPSFSGIEYILLKVEHDGGCIVHRREARVREKCFIH